MWRRERDGSHVTECGLPRTTDPATLKGTVCGDQVVCQGQRLSSDRASTYNHGRPSSQEESVRLLPVVTGPQMTAPVFAHMGQKAATTVILLRCE